MVKKKGYKVPGKDIYVCACYPKIGSWSRGGRKTRKRRILVHFYDELGNIIKTMEFGKDQDGNASSTSKKLFGGRGRAAAAWKRKRPDIIKKIISGELKIY